jgi:DNA polymerase alpha subunit A
VLTDTLQVIKTEDDDKFLTDLLGEVDANIAAPAIRKSKRHRSPERRRARVLSPARGTREPSSKKAKLSPDLPPTTHPESVQDDDFLLPMDDDIQPSTNDEVMTDQVLPSSPLTKAVARKAQVQAEAVDEDDDEEMMEVAHAGAINMASVNIAASRQIKKPTKLDLYPTPAGSSPPKAPETDIDPSSWNRLTDSLNVVDSPAPQVRTVGKMDYEDAIEEDGSLNMFWTDYTEVNGSLCLFGKVQNKKTGGYASCFVKVDNILRSLYFLPRDARYWDVCDTDETDEMDEIRSEVDEIMTKMNVGMYKSKKCHRKYAFELAGIPRQAQYLKLLYPYTSKLSRIGNS